MAMQIFTKRWRKGVWDLKAIVDSGGMPSSHSALCSVRCLAVSGQSCCSMLYCLGTETYSLIRGWVQAVTTATALEFGLGSSLFAVSLAFSLIVMYDAAGVRRHAGKLNHFASHYG